MVTHNPELAEQYSTRIVKLQDGLVVSDSNSFNSSVEPEATVEEIKQVNTQKSKNGKKEKKIKTSMSFKTAFGLSGRNLYAKKGRTFVTSFAGSIGIISVCLVLALSNGFNKYILKTEEDMLSAYPLEITKTTMDVGAIMSGMTTLKDMPELDKLGDKLYVNSFLTNIAQGMQVSNDLSDDYLKYLSEMDEEIYSSIVYDVGLNLSPNIFTDVEIGSTTKNMSLYSLKNYYSDKLSQQEEKYAALVPLVNRLGSIYDMPGTSDITSEEFGKYVLSQYAIVGEGHFPTNVNEAVLVVGGKNDVHEKAEQVRYTDKVGLMMSIMQTMLNAITYVLVAFTAISLVVSSVMIGIITYVSVVERTKEIGVLRAIGARKLDIKNLFNAETFIIGLASGAIGVGIAYLLCGVVNIILSALTGISTLASLKVGAAIIMVAVSVTFTLISGLIPAQAAAKKDPVVALRTE